MLSMDRERALLLRLADGPLAGDVLAREAGLTRAAVWKRIQALRRDGVGVKAWPGRGYALANPIELLDEATLCNLLSEGGSELPDALEVAWSLDSTNSELLRRQTPLQGVSVLLAERQTGGRGRRGRQWISPLAAHVYLSMARNFSGGLARLGGLSLVAGVAAAEALRALGFSSVQLKWPNDLVSDGRKLGGLLVEGGGEHGGPVRAVLGLGVNVRMPPEFAAAIDQPWIDLVTLDATLASRNQVAAALILHLIPALELFDAHGLAPFLPRYERLDALSGQQVEVRGDAFAVAGEYAGIAEDGALCMRTPDGLRQFHAGEVSVRPR